MSNNHIVSRVIYSLITITALISSQLVFGQSILEEILVTAQKREQSLQDVPISVATVSGDTILEGGVNRLEDMGATVPGLLLAESRNGHQIFIRGVGTSNANNSFEQSTSQFVDGIYIGRARSAVVSFLDVDRVEVLRGPQPTYFGLNTIAGGINIYSKKPTKEWEGYVNSSYGFEFEDAVVDLAYGGPLTDAFRFRVAGRWTDLDGWGQDLTTGATTNSRQSLSYRVSGEWQPIDNLTIDAKYEHSNLEQGIFLVETVGCNTVLSPQGPRGRFGIGNNNPCANLPAGAPDEFTTFDQKAAHCGTNTYTSGPQVGPPATDLSGRPDLFPCGSRAVDHYAGTFNIEYVFDNGTAFTSTTGAYTDKFEKFEDIDKTSIAGFHALLEENYTHRSQEVKLTSPGGETIDWMAGYYYQNTKDWQTAKVSISAQGIMAATMGTRFEEEGTWHSVFSAITWNITDAVSIDLGARYTDVEKSGIRLNQAGVAPTNDLAQGRPTLFNIDDSCIGIDGIINNNCAFAVFEDTNLSYSAGINWQVPTTDVMLYAKYVTGFKAGGHPNAGVDLSSGARERFEFQSENAKGIEIGAKSTWLDGALEVNLNIFRTAISDLQVATLDPIATAANPGTPINLINNAGKAITQGVEADGRWAITENLTMNYSAVYLDAQYDRFPGALCNQFETAAGQCDPVLNTRNRSGFKLEYVADFEGNIGAAYRMPIADGMDLTLSGSLYYNSGYNASTLYIETYRQDSYGRLDLRATLESRDGTWSASAFGKNVTDEIVLTKLNTSARNGPSAFELITQRGADYGLQFRYNFGTF